MMRKGRNGSLSSNSFSDSSTGISIFLIKPMPCYYTCLLQKSAKTKAAGLFRDRPPCFDFEHGLLSALSTAFPASWVAHEPGFGRRQYRVAASGFGSFTPPNRKCLHNIWEDCSSNSSP